MVWDFIEISFVDITAINNHLDQFHVKYPSPQMTYLIAKRPVDNHSFTSGLEAAFTRVGSDQGNNLYVTDIKSAYGIFWSCDAKEAISAKARNIKNQIFAAQEQFNPTEKAVIHIWD